MDSFTSALRQLLEKEIEQRLDRLARDLLDGSARGSDVSATAQVYWDHVGYARALNDIRQWCKELESDLLKD